MRSLNNIKGYNKRKRNSSWVIFENSENKIQFKKTHFDKLRVHSQRLIIDGSSVKKKLDFSSIDTFNDT
jgi:hypothetical protein